MTNRENAARVMVAAMREWSESRWAAGWLVDLEKILYQSDEPIAEGLRAIGSLFDVWPVMSVELERRPRVDEGVFIDGRWYHLITFMEASNRYADQAE